MKRNILGGCLFLVILLLASCSNKKNYENVLPKDAAMVVSVDLASVASKSGLSGENGKATVARLSEALKSGLDGSGELIDRITENPSESGLDLTEKVYYFVESGGISTGMVARVSDEGKLGELMEVLHNQQICDAPQEADGCIWASLGRVLVAYTDDAFLALLDPKGGEAKDMLHTASMLLRQKEGFTASADFGRMKDAKGDIVMFSSLDLFPGEYVSPLTMGVSADLDLKNVKALSTINFEQGKVVVDVQNMTTDKVINGMIEKQLVATNPVQGSYLDAFPSGTFFWATGNVDGGKVYSLLCENPLIRQQFESSMMPIDFEAIFNAIKGDMALAVMNPLQGKFIAYADVTNSEFLQTFEDLKPLLALTNGQMQLLNKGTDSYEFRIQDASMIGMRGGVAQFWFGVKDNRLYITNDAELIGARVLGLTLRDCPWGEKVTGKRFFMGMNFASISGQAKQLLGANEQYAPIISILNQADYLTVETVDYKTTRLELVTKDKNKNILQVLLEVFN